MHILERESFLSSDHLSCWCLHDAASENVRSETASAFIKTASHLSLRLGIIWNEWEKEKKEEEKKKKLSCISWGRKNYTTLPPNVPNQLQPSQSTLSLTGHHTHRAPCYLSFGVIMTSYFMGLAWWSALDVALWIDHMHVDRVASFPALFLPDDNFPSRYLSVISRCWQAFGKDGS